MYMLNRLFRFATIAAERFDSPLHNAAERFDSPLHDAAGSQTSIEITPRIWKQNIKKKNMNQCAQWILLMKKKRRCKISLYCPFKLPRFASETCHERRLNYHSVLVTGLKSKTLAIRSWSTWNKTRLTTTCF
jgi:hypothetical protein